MKANVPNGKKKMILIAAVVVLVAAVATGIVYKAVEDKKYSDPAAWPVLQKQDVFPEDMTPDSYRSMNREYIGALNVASPLRNEVVSIKFETSSRCPGEIPWIVDEARDNKMLAWEEWPENGKCVLHIWSKYGVQLPEDCSYLFAGYSELTSIDFGDRVDTSWVKNMHGMFLGCTKLRNLDLSGFDTSRVTDMSCMFCDCQSLSSIQASDKFVIPLEADEMFENCPAGNVTVQ